VLLLTPMQKYTLLFFLSLTGIQATAQTVSFGFEAGVPVTSRTYSPDESRPYVIGPSIEFRLPARFALEAEALYERVGTSAQFNSLSGGPGMVSGPGTGTSLSYRQRDNVWQFPLLGKYYFKPQSSRWQPYIETGWAFRTATIHTAGMETPAGLAPFSFKGDSRAPLGIGVEAGAGVRFHVGRLAFSPEARYTRWASQDNFKKNEVGILLGVHF